MKFTEKDLQNLIAKIEGEFNSHVSKKNLKKSEENMDEDKVEDKVEDAPAEDAAPEVSPDAPAEDAAPAEDSQNNDVPNEALDENDLAELEQLYRSMKPEELKHHMDILNKITTEQQAPAQDPNAAMPQDPNAQVPPAPEAPIAPEAPVPANEDPLALPKKDEEVFKSLKNENINLKKKYDDLEEAVKKFIVKQAPKGKAVTVSLTKSEAKKTVGSREEAKKVLVNVIRENKNLTKSDRDLINEFCLDKTMSISKIEHLL